MFVSQKNKVSPIPNFFRSDSITIFQASPQRFKLFPNYLLLQKAINKTHKYMNESKAWFAGENKTKHPRRWKCKGCISTRVSTHKYYWGRFITLPIRLIIIIESLEKYLN